MTRIRIRWILRAGAALVVSGGLPVHGSVLGKKLTLTGGSAHYDVGLSTVWASYFGL